MRSSSRGAGPGRSVMSAAALVAAHSSCLDRATVAFELYFRNGVKRHSHLLEPGGDGVLIGRFHHADRFAFGQVGEAAITFDGRVLLRRLRKLAELVGGEFSSRQRVCAHEFCHNFSFLSFYGSWFSRLPNLKNRRRETGGSKRGFVDRASTGA